MKRPFQQYAHCGRMSLGGATNIAKLRQNFEIFVKFDAQFCDTTWHRPFNIKV